MQYAYARSNRWTFPSRSRRSRSPRSPDRGRRDHSAAAAAAADAAVGDAGGSHDVRRRAAVASPWLAGSGTKPARLCDVILTSIHAADDRTLTPVCGGRGGAARRDVNK